MCPRFIHYIFILFGLYFTVESSQQPDIFQDTIGRETQKDDHIYILLVGLSGSGKSSTINTLLNATVAAVGTSESTTTGIFEYSLGHSDAFGTDLRLIDTPGLEDTGGLEYDAKFLATLEEFLNNHEILSLRPPDVVLICSRFDDNRFHGESSKFVKMLRSIGVLQSQIVNTEYSNLIFVFTHLMGVPEKEAKNPKYKIAAIENTIKEFSLFPTPIKIVLAENKGEENELERDEFGFRLPNGETYPQNVCLAVKLILSLGQKNNPKVQFMSDVCSPTASKSATVIRMVSETALVPTGDLRAAKFLEMLTAANLGIDDTEISRHIKTIFEKMSGKENLPPDTLILIQKALHLRRIIKLSDIPQTDVEIAALFRHLQRIQGVDIVFKAAFGLKSPRLHSLQIIGNCYDIISDSVLETTPFKMNSGLYNLSELGFATPSSVILTLNSQIKYFHHKFISESEYINKRFIFLGAEKYADPICKVNTKPGFNIISRGSCPSLLIEFRTIRLDLHASELDPLFLSQLKLLPNFNISSPDSIKRWRTFFSAFGGYVINSAFGGGSIELLIDNYPCNSRDLQEIFQELMIDRDISVLANITNSKRLNILGGDAKYYSETPELFFGGKGSSLFEKWKASLSQFPTTLFNDLQLKPLENILSTSDVSLTSEIKKAFQFFHAGAIGDHPLFTRLNEVEERESALQTKFEALTVTKDNLDKDNELLSKAKNEMESKNVELLKELMAEKEQHSNTKAELLKEKMAGTLQVSEIKALNFSIVTLQTRIESEKNNTQSFQRQLEVERELHSNTTAELQKEKISRNLQTSEVNALNFSIAAMKIGIENENNNAKSLQQILDRSRATLDTLQTTSRDNRCGETFNSEEGVIMYKYLSKYANNERCVWIVRVPKNYTKIKFTKLTTEFEVGNDYLTIFTFNKEGYSNGIDLGNDGNGVQSATLNGSVAMVVFTTDQSVVNKGFVLHFKAEAKQESSNYEYYRDYIFDSPSGRLSYPTVSPYQHNELSLFVISNSFFRNTGAFPKFKIKMVKKDIEKCGETVEACSCDRLMIYHMEKDTLAQRMRYCGSENDRLYEFMAPDLFVLVFGTDGTVSKSGFEIEWSLS